MESTLTLRVNVIKGRDLAAKDRGGTSDPYLVVSLGSARESTPTISKTLNPDWNVTFELPISGVPLLECVCWDRDRFGRDYMGEFDIPLEEIFAEGETQHQVHAVDTCGSSIGKRIKANIILAEMVHIRIQAETRQEEGEYCFGADSHPVFSARHCKPRCNFCRYVPKIQIHRMRGRRRRRRYSVGISRPG
jgi:hypothetical protein